MIVVIIIFIIIFFFLLHLICLKMCVHIYYIIFMKIINVFESFMMLVHRFIGTITSKIIAVMDMLDTICPRLRIMYGKL